MFAQSSILSLVNLTCRAPQKALRVFQKHADNAHARGSLLPSHRHLHARDSRGINPLNL